MTRSRRRLGTVVPLSLVLIGAGIALSNFTIVRAEQAPPPKSKSFTCSSGTACLQANSSGASTSAILGTATVGTADAIIGTAFRGDGLYGSSSYGYGVVGSSGATAGVFGESTASGSYSFPGVYGYSSGGNSGVAGYSSGGTGTSGITPSGAYGIYGSSASDRGNGVYGADALANGVYGYGITGTVGDACCNGGLALYAVSESNYAELFQAFNNVTGAQCLIDAGADVYCSGSINGGRLRARHRASTGEHVLAYGSESASATIEDVGRARLFDGVANVEISPDFASVINRNGEYYVFLTPRGDTRGLYVSMQTPSAFQVRENMRGRSSVVFDYRIVARPIDADGDRLPAAPRMHRPHLALQHPAPPRFPPPPPSH
jgi:hypothetical protein